MYVSRQKSCLGSLEVTKVGPRPRLKVLMPCLDLVVTASVLMLWSEPRLSLVSHVLPWLATSDTHSYK